MQRYIFVITIFHRKKHLPQHYCFFLFAGLSQLGQLWCAPATVFVAGPRQGEQTITAKRRLKISDILLMNAKMVNHVGQHCEFIGDRILTWLLSKVDWSSWARALSSEHTHTQRETQISDLELNTLVAMRLRKGILDRLAGGPGVVFLDAKQGLAILKGARFAVQTTCIWVALLVR